MKMTEGTPPLICKRWLAGIDHDARTKGKTDYLIFEGGLGMRDLIEGKWQRKTQYQADELSGSKVCFTHTRGV